MNTAGTKVIITGTTGMVGEGVLHECLHSPAIASVLIINRKPAGVSHPKLKEIIHSDFYDLSPIESQLSGYDACFFCLGVTSVGLKEDAYTKLTYALTMHVAETLSKLNKSMTFCYVSGAGTDSTEQGKSMWARVKGKTENDLMKLPFHKVFAIRPGFIKPIKGLIRTHSFYKYILWMYPLGRALYPAGFCTMQELARAMIRTATVGYDKSILEGKDIIQLGK
ncbi:MAG TPA: NAD-dependent epimerase/dehydratase family protein [Cyclobacteriaceae bacterium]|nr:NAD-dependent epimerase/dehydratase family protein [Cyclobacteriaceae bacterium]